jgi:hypothetical protein
MRAYILALLLILFVGFAGALMPAPTFNSGPESGISVEQLVVKGDAQVKGNLYTNGTVVTDGAIGTDMLVGSGIDLRFTGGNSLFDMSGASGVWKGPTGVNTFAGIVSAPTVALRWGTGAAQFGGLVTMANQKTNGTLYSVGAVSTDALLKAATIKSNATIYAVTTLNSGGTATVNALVSNTTVTAPADGIRANSIILPGEIAINVPILKVDFAAGELNRTIFIADDAWTITSIEEVHNTAETTAATLPLSVQKMTGTQALTGGINVTTAAFSLKSTANTVVTGTLSTTVGGVGGRTTLADGNRLGIICNLTGTNVMNEFRGGVLTIHMKRV